MQQVEARSIRADMVADSAESWARLRLVQGESDTRAWELVGAEGQIVLTVGQSEESSWRVAEEGVKPLHFSLHWDGSSLRIADTHSAGDVRVDGEVIGAQWVPLVERVRIDFGKAALVVETSATAAPSSSSRPPARGAGAPSGGGTPSVRQSKATLIGVPSLVAASTRAKAGEADLSAAKKMTLLGVAGPASSAPPASDSDNGTSPAAQRASAQRMPKETLIGVTLPTGAHAAVSQAGAAGALRGGASDSSRPPGGASSRVTMRGGSSAPPPKASEQSAPPEVERVGGSWQEQPAPGAETPEELGATLPGTVDFGQGEVEERFSDAPTEMREPTFQSRAPRAAFPWRYVGIAGLTTVAYFAWLYLLDHL